MGNAGRVLGNFLATVPFRANSTLMEDKVHSSSLKLVPSDVVWWLMSKAVQLVVMSGGAAGKWCDKDTSKGGERAEKSKVWLKDW